MAKVALYRKYRPARFEELLGQEHVTQTLKNAVKGDNFSHAYIFTGPRGTGKTSAARLLAVSVNCEKQKDGEPCGKCDSCKMVFENKSIDIVEIDAASNRGIDEIRELKENVKFTPAKLKFKVFIIDEVHMLTKEAFNALLKTLEEPPAHAIFILATTEIHKVPQTILSRCQRFDFKRITINDLMGQLNNIAKNEKIKITKEALSIIAESSEGGFRDAISYLDQISSYKSDEIGSSDVTDLLGMSDYKSLIDFVRYLKDEDAKNAIDHINNLVEEGMDINQFTKNTLEFLRKLLLVKVIGEEKVELAEEHLKAMQEIAKEITAKRIANFMEIILENANKFKNAPLPQIPLEISAVMICGDEENISVSNSVSDKKGIEKIEDERVAGNKISEKEIKINNKDEKFQKNEVDAENIEIETSENIDNESFWHDFLLEVRGQSSTIYPLLKVCTYSFKGDELCLVFPFRFHKERVEDRKNKKVLEEALRRVYNKPYKIVCSVKENAKDKNKDLVKEETVGNVLNIFGGEFVE